MGVVFKRTLFRGEAPAFIMELPPYRMPSLRSVCLHTWEKGKHFLVKAGTYILAVSVIVWFLLHLPWGVENKRDSYLGKAGQVMAPALAPLGFGTWEAASSLITGVIAKEIVVGTMAEIYAPGAPSRRTDAAPTLGEDLKEIGVSFGAGREGSPSANVVSTVGHVVDVVRGRGARATRRSRSPCAARSRRSRRSASWCSSSCTCRASSSRSRCGRSSAAGSGSGSRSRTRPALAWGMALLVYQGGRLLGLGG